MTGNYIQAYHAIENDRNLNPRRYFIQGVVKLSCANSVLARDVNLAPVQGLLADTSPGRAHDGSQ